MAVRDIVLVPFYRGAVVFKLASELVSDLGEFSSPFIEERLYLKMDLWHNGKRNLFSSPFIEERLYLIDFKTKEKISWKVLVPFYRGAVVFIARLIYNRTEYGFSSPFIEERLYFLSGADLSGADL